MEVGVEAPVTPVIPSLRATLRSSPGPWAWISTMASLHSGLTSSSECVRSKPMPAYAMAAWVLTLRGKSGQMPRVGPS